MNLKSLSIESMIALSDFLVHSQKVRDVLDPHLLGHASLAHVALAHEAMVAMRRQRADNQGEVARLTQLIKTLEQTHNRKARSFQHGLIALREGSDDPALGALCDELLTRCFPDGLNLNTRSYVDKAGWCMAMRKVADASVMARLDAVQMGPYSLGEILRAWLDAGEELGARVFERDQVLAATTPTGADAGRININKVRSLWIRTMNAFVANVNLLPLEQAQRELVLSPIEHSVQRTLGANARAAGAELDMDSDTDTDNDADAGADDAADSDADSDAGADAGADDFIGRATVGLSPHSRAQR